MCKIVHIKIRFCINTGNLIMTHMCIYRVSNFCTIPKYKLPIGKLPAVKNTFRQELNGFNEDIIKCY